MMAEDALLKRYSVVVRYMATTANGPKPTEWTFAAEEISEDDAIHAALIAFRRDEVTTWEGWPRDVLVVTVEQKEDE